MKKQIHIFCLLASMLLLCNISEAQVRFGIKTGLNLANIAYSDDYIEYSEEALGGDISTGMALNFHLGGMAEFDFGHSVGLSLGLQLNGKGGSLDAEGEIFGQSYTVTSTVRPLYLQIPVALTFRRKGFYAGVGPYIAFGVGGKVKSTAKAGGQTEKGSDSLDFGSDASDAFSKIDYGAGLELGYEFNSIRLSAAYNLGLANVLPKDGVEAGDDLDLDFKYTHNVIGFSIAYLFKGK